MNIKMGAKPVFFYNVGSRGYLNLYQDRICMLTQLPTRL